jgi:M6 family metalloprotease-like protein
LTSWQTPDGPNIVEHLAGQSPSGDLLVFFWQPGHDWGFVNVTAITGQKIAGPLTSWQTPDGPNIVEHLAGQSPSGDLLVFFWQPGHDWGFVNVSRQTGAKITGPISALTLRDGDQLVETLTARGQDGSHLYFWWTPRQDWQVLDLTAATGYAVQSAPTNWVTTDGSQTIEHSADATDDGNLIVVWTNGDARRRTDAISNPFGELRRIRTHRRLLTILWDPKVATQPRQTPAEIEAALFGSGASVRSYFLENSDGYFTIENAGIVGWMDSSKPKDFYWREGDYEGAKWVGTSHYYVDGEGKGWYVDDEGFYNGHTHKYAEAVRRAADQLDFAAFDVDANGELTPDELGVLLVIPQDSGNGFVRGVVGRQLPSPEDLVVDGVKVRSLAEVYSPNPYDVATTAHELSHLLLSHSDMYFNFVQPYRAGAFSLMDQHWLLSHLDAVSKLKLGWMRPRLAMRTGWYTLADVETRYDTLVLQDPTRLDEYFVLENRWPGPSLENRLPDSGIAVWHVMENPQVYEMLLPPAGTNPDDWAKPQWRGWARRGIRLLRPVLGDGFSTVHSLWDGAESEAGYDLESTSSDPQRTVLRWADGTPSGFAVRNISCSAATMNIYVEVPWASDNPVVGPPPTQPTCPRSPLTPSVSFRIVPGAPATVSHQVTSDMSLTMTLPAGASRSPVEVTIATGGPARGKQPVLGDEFTVTAYDVGAERKPVEVFAQPFRLSVRYARVSAATSNQVEPVLAYWDPVDGEWLELASSADSATGLIVAEPNRTGVYALLDGGAIIERLWIPAVRR